MAQIKNVFPVAFLSQHAVSTRNLTFSFTKPLTLDNTLFSFVERIIIIFMIYGVFVGICLFLLQKTIATALVPSRLDYFNSIFQNIAFKDVTKIQHVQNCLATVVIRRPRLINSAII